MIGMMKHISFVKDNFVMNLEALHGKVIEIGKKNKKTLVGLAQHLMQRRKDMREEQNMQISDYRKEYEELVKLNQESE